MDSSKGPLVITRCMRGTTWNPSSPALGFAGTSFIKCNNQVAKPCVTINNPVNVSAQIENVTIAGSVDPPVAGSTGFQWVDGGNIVLTNVHLTTFDTCAYYGPVDASGTGPIRARMVNMMLTRCQKHYVVQDGTPGLTFIGGNWGGNGATDYNADDFFYGTKTTSGGGGAGPNGLVLDTVHLNPGGKTIGCAFRWGGFMATGGAFNANKIINSHIEVKLGSDYTPIPGDPLAAQRGFFCVDSTVPIVPEVLAIGDDFAEDGLPKVLPLFNIDPAVPFGNGAKLTFIGDLIQSAATKPDDEKPDVRFRADVPTVIISLRR